MDNCVKCKRKLDWVSCDDEQIDDSGVGLGASFHYRRKAECKCGAVYDHMRGNDLECGYYSNISVEYNGEIEILK